MEIIASYIIVVLIIGTRGLIYLYKIGGYTVSWRHVK